MGSVTGSPEGSASRPEPSNQTDRPHTVVITGASSGAGLALAEQLARRGHHLVLVGRDPHRLGDAVERVGRAGAGRTPDAHRADFAVLDEVRALSDRLRAAYPRIDVLVHHADTVCHHRSVTVDGFETTMQVNHLAGFLLSHRVLDSMSHGGARLVSLSSAVERVGALDPADLSGSRRRYSRWQAYGSSRQATVLFSAEAARRWAGRGIVPTTCYHSGVMGALLGRLGRLAGFDLREPGSAPARGATETAVWLTTTSGATPGGCYRGQRRVDPSLTARDPLIAERLWEASAQAVGCS